jgi:hypothetical protein
MQYTVSNGTLGLQCGVRCAVASKVLFLVFNASLVPYDGSMCEDAGA